jgi:hypothetical protein
MSSLRSLYTTEPAFGAYSKSVTTAFTIPALGETAVQEFDNATWMSVGQAVFFSDGINWAYLTVTAIDEEENDLTLENTWGEINGTTIAIEGKLSPAGVKGSQGVAGNDGAQGLPGNDGVDGSNGSDGIDGVDGKSAYEVAVEQGFIGDVNEWLTYITGTDGDDGAPGTDGNDGLSAYEVAVNAGFVGNETAWLASLVGPQGEQGEAGSDGADGEDGDSAYDVAVANGFIGTEEAWLLTLRGPKGDTGAAGADGDTGATGLSAYLVAVNNGFLGDQEAWLESLVGPQGEQGVKGEAGNQESVILLLTPPEVNITLDASIPVINYFPYGMANITIRASLDVAPTGSAAVINVFKNGSTMLDSSKLTIAAGTKTVVGILVATTIDEGDVISASIDQIGATVPGQYLTVTINGERA